MEGTGKMRRISVQLWSLRKPMQKDIPGTLKRLADMGFKAVEPAGFGEYSALDFKKMCNDLGLDIPSSHTPWANDPATISEAMDMVHALGLNWMVCGGGVPDFENTDTIKRFADKINAVYEVASRNGFTMFQHNHAFEFERMDDGRLKYEFYHDLVPEAIKMELDTYWCANFGAENPVDIIKKYSDRIVLAHIKDGLFERNVPNVALGEGKMDIPAVVKALPETVKTLVIEFDECGTDIFEAVRKSRNYLVELGFGE